MKQLALFFFFVPVPARRTSVSLFTTLVAPWPTMRYRPFTTSPIPPWAALPGWWCG